ncbi:TPA: hypothetical protein DIV49_03105 [Candidatus Saccharibacteria bacterium]|nr:hypothetical protein [Candidatus Saccharibacteria bacterium]
MYYETDAAFDQHRRDLEAGNILTYDPNFNPAENGMEGELTVYVNEEVVTLYDYELELLEQEVRLQLESELHNAVVIAEGSTPAEAVIQAVEEALQESMAELEELEIEHPKFSAAIHEYVAVELAKRLEGNVSEFHGKLLEIIVIGDIVRDLQDELDIEEGGYDNIAEEMMHFADAMRDRAFVEAELMIVHSGELNQRDTSIPVPALYDLEIEFEAPTQEPVPAVV